MLRKLLLFTEECDDFSKNRENLPQVKRGQYKSFGGRQVLPDEYPWLASLYHVGSRGVYICSGVQISSRHILTAAHCVVDYSKQEYYSVCKTEDEYKNRNLKDFGRFQIYVGSGCNRPELCHSRHHPLKVSLHKHWGKCDGSLDLAIIELDRDTNPSETSPISMPTVNTELAKSLNAAGIGADTTLIGDVNANGLQVITLRVNETNDDPYFIKTWSRTASLCQGDSGGPLFQLNSAGKYVLMGIASLSTRCELERTIRRNYFVDIRMHLDWICKQTGVCP
ncbi:hypothetical protein Y032_0023g879 [Ancylostoma ceylanicum]|uniref:Peptidase S1 domain-containing protein n=1 Tax=Ancylostoma ceylanicum TaxID=53326 RepID=A0A016UZB8_9BILA|nr:hypothetical protein Y032_0023g879 [Ancylostoma ceylanicum]